MKSEIHVRPSESLRHVRYEIRGGLARRAHELQRMGYEIISLNIGNPGAFGFRTPETMRLAMIENLSDSEGYCHQKGIFPAREAVVMQQQGRGVTGVTVRETKPLSSKSLSVDASIFWLISPTSRRSALKRRGPAPSTRTTSKVHLSLMRASMRLMRSHWAVSPW